MSEPQKPKSRQLSRYELMLERQKKRNAKVMAIGASIRAEKETENTFHPDLSKTGRANSKLNRTNN